MFLYRQCSIEDFYSDSEPVFFDLCRSKHVPTLKTLQSMYIEPSTLSENQTQGQFNISWDPLPCHLQNCADTSDYTIQLSTGVATSVSSRHSSLLCSQESGGPYLCRVPNSMFNTNQTYTFQVAARNNNGVGSFSDPITKLIPITLTSQGIDPIIL